MPSPVTLTTRVTLIAGPGHAPLPRPAAIATLRPMPALVLLARLPLVAFVAALAAALAVVPAARAADENGPWIPASLQIGFDANLSGEVGADEGIALHYAEGRLEDRFLKPRFWSEERFWPHLAGFGYRAARSLLLDDPLAAWLTVAQHE